MPSATVKTLNPHLNPHLHAAPQGGLPLAWYDPATAADPNAARLYALQKLTCTHCGLSGPIPDWTSPSALTTVQLAYNSLTGALPTWSGFTTLVHLNASHNMLTGFMPASW